MYFILRVVLLFFSYIMFNFNDVFKYSKIILFLRFSFSNFFLNIRIFLKIEDSLLLMKFKRKLCGMLKYFEDNNRVLKGII